ncbi:transporter [Hydrogenovibrio halophilus]|uniref:transporter n=1 Tax=Hydrogenovibrio halophilus TaxID=373391 RepID=UPI0003828FDE|nr:transporter [Hydrogenovibrio halophilus]
MKSLKWSVAIGVFALLQNAQAAVVEVLPGQFSPQTKPLTVLSLKTQFADYGGFYNSGQSSDSVALQDTELKVSLTHFNRFQGVPVLGVLSAGGSETRREKPSKANNQGLDDIQVAGGFWPWVSQDRRHHLGLALAASLPTGQYDQDEAVNTGHNRYRFLGIVNLKLTLHPNWVWETYGMYERQTDSTDARYGSYDGTNRYDPSGSVTTYLSYKSDQHWQVYVGLEESLGGESTFEADNGAVKVTTDAQDDTRMSVGGRLPLSRSTLLSLRYSQTVRMQTGYRQNAQWILGISQVL